MYGQQRNQSENKPYHLWKIIFSCMQVNHGHWGSERDKLMAFIPACLSLSAKWALLWSLRCLCKGRCGKTDTFKLETLFEMRFYGRIMHIIWYQMASDDNECMGTCGEELILTRLLIEQLTADVTSRIWHGRWGWNPRTTQKKMARRYQGVVPDGCAFSKHLGTIKNRMEALGNVP